MKKPWVLCALCLTAAALIMFANLDPAVGNSAAAPDERIILLTQNENGTYYLQAKKGMLDAADALGGALSVALIDEDVVAQARGLAEDGYTAAVVLAERADLSQTVSDALSQAGIPCVSAGVSAGTSSVTRNPASDAALIADALTQAGLTRALVLPDAGGALSNAFLSAWTGAHTMLASAEDAANARTGDGIIALSADAARAAIALKRSGEIPGSVPLYCVDTGQTRSDDLETLCVRGMLLEQPYTVGFLACKIALKAASGAEIPSVTYAPCRMITPETMYAPENVGMVFPLIQ